jgi:glycosyltransferase involved in cell wall biosynthesis
MRILTVSNCPALDHLGSGYVIGNFVNGLRAAGHEVDLVQPDDYELCQWMRPRANSYRQAVGMLIATSRALMAKKYDIIEFWGGEAWLATRWIVRHKGPRPMIVQHTNGPETRYSRILLESGLANLTSMQSWHAESLLRAAFCFPDAIVTVSEYDRTWLAEQHLPLTGKLKAIENPLPACFIGRCQERRESRIIGFCGTWLPKKGIGVVVRDMTPILREFPEWRFLVLGTNEGDKVQSCFPDDIRQRIEVMPMIRDKEALAQQYERMAIFVLPSVLESFGLALAEAMACGCAAVTTRVGFGASLVHGREALLLDKATSPYLYQSAKQLMINPELRRRLAVAGWQRVQTLRWDHAIRSLSDTYENWLDEYRW